MSRTTIEADRLIALTDGVIAVIITIMVLELKPPHYADAAALATLWPTFLSFALSFIYVAIYWSNHHHFFRFVPHVDAAVLWANFNLLFWLSLIPFATAWMDEQKGASLPTALYGLVLLACALSWYVMQAAIIRAQGTASPLGQALGRDLKGKLSPPAYLLAMGLAFVLPALSLVIYAALAVLWLIPDRRLLPT